MVGKGLITNETNSKLWPAAKVKNYFTLIRHINPKVSADAERVLRAYYTRQRSLQSRQASRTTPRLLQSLIRLAEGHARLMFRSEVLVSDAVTAIILIESSMLGNSILEGLSPLHTVFPDNPEAEYFEKAACIFKNLDIESPAKESFGCFYEESTLNRLLLNISSVWSPKEDPFIFGSSACNSSHNSDLFQETLADKNESSTSKLQSFEDPTKSTESFFRISTEKPPTSLQGYHHVQDTVMAEIHRNGDIIPNTIQNPNENEVHHPSPADMLVEEITNLDTSSGALNNSQVKTSQVSILDQILCEDFEGNNDASLNPSHIALCAPGTISENQTVTSRTKAFSENFLEKQRSQEIISKKHPHERNKVDILEELGISSSEELINSANNALDLPTKALHSSSEKYRDASSMLKAKKSIAEQLKSFTFKQCQVDTRNSSNQSIKSLSNNNLKSSSKIGKDFSSNEDCDNKVEIASQSSRKNAVFHMIKNKSKSCFTDKVCPSTSKIAENDQSTQNKSSNILNMKMKSKDSPSESTSIHVGNDPSRDSQSLSVAINNTTKSASIDLENQTNRHSLSSLPAINTDKPELTNEKKSVRNDLKKFAFSKIKFSKNLNS